MKNSNSEIVPDTLIRNADIYVECGHFAEALLIDSAGVIAAVGTFDEVSRAAFDKGDVHLKIIDAEGRTIIPGFNDSHMHLAMTGAAMNEVRLNDATSIEEVVTLSRCYLAEHPDIKILWGRGWNQERFSDEKRLLTKFDLDRISTDIPVVLERVCAHAICGNTRAAELSGVTYAAGEEGVDVGQDGAPSGLVRENACRLYRELRGALGEEELLRNIDCAAARAVSYGITSVQTCDAGGAEWKSVFDAYERYTRSKENCCLRFAHQCWLMNVADVKRFCAEVRGMSAILDNPFNRVSAVKLFMDGSLGARTAALRAPYADEPDNVGTMMFGEAELTRMVEEAEGAGLPVLVHAIGDRAVESLLSVFEANAGEASLRHGIVHAQITDKSLLDRMARAVVQVLIQPVSLKSDIAIVEKRVGKALALTSYAFGTMKKLGIPMSIGTDSPIESMNPFENIYFALTRKADGNSEAFYPEECLDICDAVDAYTTGSAYAENAENCKGRIRPGFAADLAVLDRNIFEITPEEVRKTRVTATLVGGRLVYGKI